MMTRYTALTAAALMMASAAAPAVAQQSRTTAAPQRVVMLCDSDMATRAAYRRDFGQRATFMTADQVLEARATGRTWAAPACMTAREHARLTQTLTAYAAVR